MKTLSKTLLALSLVIASSAHAEPVKTSGKALSLCKAEASEKHTGYKRSSMKKVKQTRAGYKLKMRVLTETGSSMALCEVTKDGQVTYSTAS